MKIFLTVSILILSVSSPPALTGGAARRQPAASAESLSMTAGEIDALVKECGWRTSRMWGRILDYTYTETDIEYELDQGGRVGRERSKVYEVYPARGRRFARVQVSEDGAGFSAEKIGRERARAVKALTEAEEAEARAQARAPVPAGRTQGRTFQSFWITLERDTHGGASKSYWPVRPTDFLTSHEFYAPRRAILAGRAAILLSFRPRPAYVYDKSNVPFKEGIEDYARVMSQLGGRIWIDGSDKVIMRLEAVPVGEVGRTAEGDAPDAGAPLGFELTRLPEGTWVPARGWYNSHGREGFFWKTAISRAISYSDFKLFKASVVGEKLDPPSQPPGRD
jgi:hypothetical protein